MYLSKALAKPAWTVAEVGCINHHDHDHDRYYYLLVCPILSPSTPLLRVVSEKATYNARSFPSADAEKFCIVRTSQILDCKLSVLKTTTLSQSCRQVAVRLPHLAMLS